MSYRRVIPRDLFNEGNLLKCYGQLYLNLEKLGLEDSLVHEWDLEPFRIKQWQEDGSLSLVNVTLHRPGHTCLLYRPLNARGPYPLWMLYEPESIKVFEDDGRFTPEMLAFLKTGECN